MLDPNAAEEAAQRRAAKSSCEVELQLPGGEATIVRLGCRCRRGPPDGGRRVADYEKLHEWGGVFAM